MKKNFDAIGLMSGTSLDGLDIAFCEFRLNGIKWEFDILKAETVKYTQVWLQLLSEAPSLDGQGLALLHTSYGHWIGQTVDQFINKHKINPKIIASHGHTIFHRPNERMTLQIGSGAAIAAETGITTVNDFRSLDIALGGQGAPLVPIGDKLLFSDYDACVNIGGFANISLDSANSRKAFDICPANIVLNWLANKLGLPFDASGSIASNNKIDDNLLRKLEDLDYYKKTGPRSLGREWVEQTVIPLLDASKLDVAELLSTFTHHIAMQISSKLPQNKGNRVIFTGGGAHNHYLIQSIRNLSNCEIVVPNDLLIDFKESLIFALLGVLRMQGMINCLSLATGASKDSCSGAIHLGSRK